jgi:hypothetical protein
VTKEERERIGGILTSKGVTLPCHRCGQRQFAIAGYSARRIQDSTDGLGTVLLGGPSLPIVVVVCNTCGAISEHALGTLGMMPKSEGQ